MGFFSVNIIAKNRKFNETEVLKYILIYLRQVDKMILLRPL